MADLRKLASRTNVEKSERKHKAALILALTIQKTFFADAKKDLRVKRADIDRQLKSIAAACTHEGTLVTYSTGISWCKACKRHIARTKQCES